MTNDAFRLLENVRMQGADILRSEAYIKHVATTKDEGNGSQIPLPCGEATC